DGRVEDLRSEAGADALDLVRAGLTARQHGRGLRLDSDDLDAGLARLEHLADAGDGTAGADAGDEEVDGALRVVPDLLGRGAAVDFRIGRILELLRHDRVGQRGDQLLGAGNRPFHTLGALG